MKEIFFKGIAVAVPLVLVAGLGYMIWHGFYSLYSDMKLKRELEEIRRDSARRRRQSAAQEQAEGSTPSPDPAHGPIDGHL